MLSVALVIAAGGIIAGLLIGLLVAAFIYVIGVYVVHAPANIVGLIAFLNFVLIFLAYSGVAS